MEINKDDIHKIKLPIMSVGFYEYEFDLQEQKFKISNIDTIKVSFSQADSWYNLNIYINDKFTGKCLNLLKTDEHKGYSPRKQIADAYKIYKEGKIKKSKQKSTEFMLVPTKSVTTVKRIFKNHIKKIEKFSNRDELTELGIYNKIV